VQRLAGRVHAAAGRPAFAGIPARVAMRGRHASELSHTAVAAVRAILAARDRRLQQVDRRLGLLDLGRRLAGIRTRLVSAEARSTGAMIRRQHRAANELGNCAGRLESLSPLGVLARGYAVCWNADRTRVVRDADAVAPGDQVRVTLARGELACEVRQKTGE
jgi:exodeoxyribonuclease VII large subunit